MRDHNKEEDANNQHGQQTSVTPMPKHMPFPEYPASSELLNELIMFLFTTCAAAMQFINIYRTNWWMPDSIITNTVNFQHIDLNLIYMILIMNARRLLYCLGRKCFNWLNMRCMFIGNFYVPKLILDITVTVLPVTFIAKMCYNCDQFTILLLIYPFIIYVLVFGLKLEPFLRFNYDLKGAYFNGYPMHCCSANPNDIRLEIDVLCNDFNSRFTQVIFTSLLNTYYSVFFPCYFAHSVYYNVLHAAAHIILVFLSVFTMCTVFSFPSKYIDILHRAALHLGYWFKSETKEPPAETAVKINNATALNWNKTVLWAAGSLVKHTTDLYCSVGPVTVAIPGNNSHARFYRLFHNPSDIYGKLAKIQAIIIISCISSISFDIEWNFILSLSFITLTNHFTLFILSRDSLITKKVYMAESSVSESIGLLSKTPLGPVM